MSGKDAAPPAEPHRPLLAAVLNALFLFGLLYATDVHFRTWVQQRAERAGAWSSWSAVIGFRRLRRWWRQTSPWYQELLEQERE